jgi:hypothetical protein
MFCHSARVSPARDNPAIDNPARPSARGSPARRYRTTPGISVIGRCRSLDAEISNRSTAAPLRPDCKASQLKIEDKCHPDKKSDCATQQPFSISHTNYHCVTALQIPQVVPKITISSNENSRGIASYGQSRNDQLFSNLTAVGKPFQTRSAEHTTAHTAPQPPTSTQQQALQQFGSGNSITTAHALRQLPDLTTSLASPGQQGRNVSRTHNPQQIPDILFHGQPSGSQVCKEIDTIPYTVEVQFILA